jgi:ribosomal-protein-alanine N-acetyltransferase
LRRKRSTPTTFVAPTQKSKSRATADARQSQSNSKREGLETPLRLATSADISAIIALERDVPGLVHWSEHIYQKIFQSETPERMLWVVEEDGELHGFLVARFDAAECELENLVVAARERRRGLGSQLMQALVAIGRERHLKRILLDVRESNYAGRALYKRFGFQVNGRRRGYYSQPPEDALLLALALNCTSPSAPKR